MGLDRPADVVKNLTKRRSNQAEYFEVLRLELQHLDLRRHYIETMVQMYRAGEAERLLTFESAERKAYAPARYHRATDRVLRDDILAGRNKKWMSKIVSEMNKGNVVTAVGAGHLAGREGVLNLLKNVALRSSGSICENSIAVIPAAPMFSCAICRKKA